MVDIQTVVYVIPLLAFTVSLIYYGLNIRNANIARKSQLTMNFYQTVTNRDFWGPWTNIMYQTEFNTFEEWGEKYGPSVNPKEAVDLYTVMQVFVGAGTLLKEGVIEPELLFKYLPQMIIPASWTKLKTFVEGIRVRYNDPKFGEMFEYLYTESMRLHPNLVVPTD